HNMRSKLFSKLFSSDRSAQGKNDSSADLSELFDFLIREITIPKKASSIIAMAKEADKRKPDELLSIYLLLESHLCNFDPEQKYNRDTLRVLIAERFPRLVSDKYFSILFLTDDLKKVK